MTLARMKKKESRGEGRIYWFYEDHSYGSTPEPIWIPKEKVGEVFVRESTSASKPRR